MLLRASLVLTIVAALSSVVWAQLLTTIDFPGAGATYAEGINNSGQIVGWYRDSSGHGHGFLDNGGNFSTIDFPGAAYTSAFGINNGGQIVGDYNGEDGVIHGFLDNSGSFSTIDFPGAIQTIASGINNGGQIVGSYIDNFEDNGFLDNNGSFSTIDFPGAVATTAYGINDGGQIVGEYNTGDFANGFLDNGGSFSTIDPPGAAATFAQGINNGGQIVGWDIVTFLQGFSDTGGIFSIIYFPGATFTYASGINNSGQIVGSYEDAFGVDHGFLDARGLSMTSVTGSPNPSTFGYIVAITATVSPAGPPIPTGTVSFTSNGTGISGCMAVPLTSSLTAVCTTSALAVGTDMIVATYSGDTNYSGSSGTLSQLVNPLPVALQLVPVTPCRVVDTRNPNGPFGGPAIQGQTYRSFPIPQNQTCNIPASAVAYSLNVTVVPQGPLGYLTIWPEGEGQPVVSTLNSTDGRVKADAAVVPAGTSGGVSVYVSNTTNVILDIDGYFEAPGSGTYQFYSLPPCRLVDTRGTNGPLGGPYLQANQERDFPLLESSCIPAGLDPQAYSLNFTVVPHPAGQALGYLTVWPKGEQQPDVSTLNNPTATVVANAAIVQAGTGGKIATYVDNNTDLIIDINGYFAAPGQNGLSMYPVAPCRVLDTRQSGGSFMGEKTVNVAGSACAPPSSAQAYVFNATVVPPGSMPYLTLWPNGEQQPVVSTLNAYDGFITSNMAIVTTTNGSIDAYAAGLTQLILDISSYFAP